MTLFGRNLIWRAISATASACSRAACSSPQNALAAEVRSSDGIWRHIRAGRISSGDDISDKCTLWPDERELLRPGHAVLQRGCEVHRLSGRTAGADPRLQ